MCTVSQSQLDTCRPLLSQLITIGQIKINRADTPKGNFKRSIQEFHDNERKTKKKKNRLNIAENSFFQEFVIEFTSFSFIFLTKQITSTMNIKQNHYPTVQGEVRFGLNLNLELCLENWTLRKPSLKSERLLLEALKRVFEKPTKNCRLSNALESNP